jgi:hypothetical protein
MPSSTSSQLQHFTPSKYNIIMCLMNLTLFFVQKIENEKGIKIRDRVIYGKQKSSKCRNIRNRGRLITLNVQDLI